MAQTEQLMLVGLGFVLALILVFAFGRGVWSVSNRYAKRQSEKDIPAAMMSLRADRDKLRAEHAVMMQRLEAINESAKAKMATQTAEVSRHRNRVVGLTEDVLEKQTELHSKTAEVLNLESQVSELTQALEEQQKSSRDLVAEVAEKLERIKHLENEGDNLRTELTESRDKISRLAANFEKSVQENEGLKQEMAGSIAARVKPNGTKAPDSDLITGFNYESMTDRETPSISSKPFGKEEDVDHRSTTVPVSSTSSRNARGSRFNFDRPAAKSPGAMKFERNPPPSVKPNDISLVVKEARRNLSEAVTNVGSTKPSPAMRDGAVASEGIITLAKRLRAMQARSDEKIAKTLK